MSHTYGVSYLFYLRKLKISVWCKWMIIHAHTLVLYFSMVFWQKGYPSFLWTVPCLFKRHSGCTAIITKVRIMKRIQWEKKIDEERKISSADSWQLCWQLLVPMMTMNSGWESEHDWVSCLCTHSSDFKSFLAFFMLLNTVCGKAGNILSACISWKYTPGEGKTYVTLTLLLTKFDITWFICIHPIGVAAIDVSPHRHWGVYEG